MEIPRFKLGKEYNQYFYKFVPAMELCEDGDFVKYHELERMKEELEKCYSDIADKENMLAELETKAMCLKKVLSECLDDIWNMAREIDVDPMRNTPVLLESRKADRQLLLDVACVLQSLRVVSK